MSADTLAAVQWHMDFFLRAFTPKNERIKSCADVLIYSNLLMIAVNVVAMNLSPFIGLCLVIGLAFIWMLPAEHENEQNKAFNNTLTDNNSISTGNVKVDKLLSIATGELR